MIRCKKRNDNDILPEGRLDVHCMMAYSITVVDCSAKKIIVDTIFRFKPSIMDCDVNYPKKLKKVIFKLIYTTPSCV
jgi:hypothetical protein